MAMLGFILGFLVLGYFSVSAAITTFMLAVFDGFNTEPVFKWILPIWVIILGYLWYLLFTNAPFTVTIA